MKPQQHKEMTPQQITIAYLLDGELVTATRLYDIEMLRAEIASSMDANYGAGAWLITPTASLPADFSVDTYTIKGSKLAKSTKI